MRAFFKASLVLLAIGFLSHIAMFISAQLSDFIGVSLLVFFFMIHYPLGDVYRQLWRAVPLILLVIVFLLKTPIYSLLAVGLFLYAINLLSIRTKENSSLISALFLTTVSFSVYLLFYQHFSGFWFALNGFSQFVSKIASIVARCEVNSGLSCLGIHVSILILLFSLSSLWLQRPKNRLSWCTTPFLVVLTTYLFATLQPLLSRVLQQLDASFFLFSLHSHLLLFLLNMPLIFILSKRTTAPIKNDCQQNPKIANFWIFFLCFISISLFFLSPKQHVVKPHPSVFFFNDGNFDWNTPTFDSFGALNGGMFGFIYNTFLPAMGYKTSRDTVITAEGLKNVDIVVIVNPFRNLSPKEHDLLWSFVNSGGSLLALGDHTGVTEIREPLNNLLKPINVSLNFDAAIFWNNSWAGSFEFRPHFINTCVADELETQLRIGASLKVASPSQPIIIAKYGFSDKGNMLAANNGYLGDMRYSQGERLGDLILVAQARYGKGKVLVFGDTTPFQNSVLQYCSDFVSRTFEWLIASEQSGMAAKLIYALFFLVIALLCCILYVQKGRLLLPVLCFALAVALFSLVQSGRMDRCDSIQPMISGGSIAIVDNSHFEPITIDDWKDNGTGGLIQNLMRNHYIPIVSKKFSEQDILQCKLFALIAPAKRFSKSEQDIIVRFVSQGGLLLITCGFDQYASITDLLSRFSLGVQPSPLGRITPQDNRQGFSFCDAWPISIIGGEHTVVLCSAWNHPLAVFQPYGKGGVFLAGDSRFLLNENLEGVHNVSLPNVMLLRKIIEIKVNKDVN
jgi:hypothetical protein